MKFTQPQKLLCLAGGSVLGLMIGFHAQPFHSLADVIGSAIGGIIVCALAILLAKLVKMAWNAIFHHAG